MSLIDLKCQESISFARDGSCIDFNKTSLLLGHDVQIFLYFELPSFLYAVNLKQARLVLFKIPACFEEDCISCCCNQYYVTPLSDFFSIYSPVKIDCSRQISFEDPINCSYTEVDITGIVESWISHGTENNGLLLLGNQNSKYISYGSEKYKIIRMRPLLRLIYEQKSFDVCQPLSQLPCTVKVQNQGTT